MQPKRSKRSICYAFEMLCRPTNKVKERKTGYVNRMYSETMTDGKRNALSTFLPFSLVTTQTRWCFSRYFLGVMLKSPAKLLFRVGRCSAWLLTAGTDSTGRWFLLSGAWRPQMQEHSKHLFPVYNTFTTIHLSPFYRKNVQALVWKSIANADECKENRKLAYCSTAVRLFQITVESNAEQ